MPQIKPSLIAEGIVCADSPAPSNGLVVFGASGDLARRKLFGSVFELFKHNLLDESFYLLGTGRKKLSDQEFREMVFEAIASNSEASKQQLREFLTCFHYTSGDYKDLAFYQDIKKKLTELDKTHSVDGRHIYYLSVPPFLYETIVENLGTAGLSCTDDPPQTQPNLVVEKPFGRDLQSALDLSEKIHKCFDESQVYRIDHYLGKETVQNILMFRFANTIFEPVWNRNYIDHVQITIAESLGVEDRSGYYDTAGALRDMFQNHVLQMLSLAAMEPPTSFAADHIRDEKVKLLKSIRPFDLNDLDNLIVRGQYGKGIVDSKDVSAYRADPDISNDSKTETFVAAKLFIDNWRWKDVPFYVRTGKRLSAKDTEIAITFKQVPHSMFADSGIEELDPNVLILQIQPEEGLSLSFQAKRPGAKMCIGTLDMSFSYQSVFGVHMPEAYQRLLLDCMTGDQTLFTRTDDVEQTWQLLTPVLKAWADSDKCPYEYPAGSQSFTEADRLIETSGRKWRKLAE